MIFLFEFLLYITNHVLNIFLYNYRNMLVNPEMYEDNNSTSFDRNSIQGLPNDGFSQANHPQICNPNFSIEEQHLTYHQNHPNQDAALEMEFQNQLILEMDHCYNPNTTAHHINDTTATNTTTHFMQEVVHDEPNWDYYQQEQNNGGSHQNQYSQTPDLLNLFNIPRSTLLPNSSINFSNQTHDSGPSVLYDPLLHLNLPPQPPVFRDLFQGLPHGYGLPGSRTGSLFGGLDEIEGSGGVYQDGDGSQFDNGVLEFRRGRDGKDTKHFATERQRRVHLNDKYKALRSLVPNPTKPDRASVVGDAIQYIEELKRTVTELKILVEKKRCSRERMKRHKMEDGSAIDQTDSINMKPHGDPDQSFNGSSSLRSSWLQRKSKNTEVDVRIIDDEATIKLVQQKRINCLLFVSKALDELQLDLHHVAGGVIGDFYSFLFNTKVL
ncbi:hypothetical protein LguiB_011124 [Lonicera macranthoides]